jgi:hypothetical protein
LTFGTLSRIERVGRESSSRSTVHIATLATNRGSSAKRSTANTKRRKSMGRIGSRLFFFR